MAVARAHIGREQALRASYFRLPADRIPLYHILYTGDTLIKTYPKRVTKYFHPCLDFRICSPYTLACL